MRSLCSVQLSINSDVALAKEVNMSAFNDFVTRRCEEILTNDKNCNNMNQKLIDTEKEIRENMSKEQIDKFEEYMDTVLKLNVYCEKLMYIQGFNDRLAVF